MKLLKLIFNITAIYILLALVFDIETAFITLLCVVAPIVLILAIGVMRTATRRSSSDYIVEYDTNGHDYWTPGQPAINQKAFVQGFFG